MIRALVGHLHHGAQVLGQLAILDVISIAEAPFLRRIFLRAC